MTRSAAAALCFAAISCAPLPDSYPIPPQRPNIDAPEPQPFGATVSFADPRSVQQVVSGFLRPAPDQLWQWASENPTVRVRIGATDHVYLRVAFTLPPATHGSLMPVSIRFLVNGQPVGENRYTEPGVLEYRVPVRPELLKANDVNLIRCEATPMYIAPADGVKLSMVMREIGLERQLP